MSKDFHGLPGKLGGLAVKSMIREVEERMANGEHISAGPDSPAESAHLQRIKAENERSGESVR